MLASPAGQAQEAGRTYRLGLLTILPQPADQASPVYSDAPTTDAFLAALRASGYVEGENLAFERRFAAGSTSPSVGAPERIGSVSMKVIQHAPCAVTVVR